MIIPFGVLSDFVRFITNSFGSKAIIHSEDDFKKSGEYARFMLGNTLFVIRKQDEQSENCETLEVVSSDLYRMDQIEKMWYMYIHTKIEKDLMRNGDASTSNY